MKQSLLNINKGVIHCAYTPPQMDIGVKEIREWHLARKFKDCGYHIVVRRDGSAEKGRDLTTVPAANGRGNNLNTITICYVGGMSADRKRSEDNRTDKQKETIKKLIKDFDELLQKKLEWVGHRDLPGVLKTCPCYDVKTEH